jgi:hypothetical protein
MRPNANKFLSTFFLQFQLTPANNTFTHLQPTPPSDINAYNGGGFTYKYAGAPAGGIQDPIYITANIFKNGCLNPIPFVYSTNTCPSKLTVTGTGGCTGCTQITILQNNATTNQQIANQLIATLTQALADGNSPTLMAAIASNMADGNLKNALLDKSPYLSDAVLTAYVQRAATPAAGNLKQVIIANSPVSVAVKTAVDNLGLPKGIQNQIDAAQVGTSVVAQKQQEIAYYNFTKDLAVNEIVRYYLQDTVTPYVYDNIVKWLEWNNTKIAKVDLVFAKTATGDFTRAQYLIDSLATDPANAQYIPYLQTNKDVAASGQTWDSLLTNPATKTLLLQIANDSLHPHMGHARAVLGHAFKNNANYEFIEGLNSSSNARVGSTSELTNQPPSIYNTNLLALSAYPNPFNSVVKINYIIDDTEAIGTVEISLFELATGKLISKQTSTKNEDVIDFNTENLANGVYLINLKNDSGSLGNLKIISIK